ncbi:hydrolase [Kitasatospora kifunensis]|uniref:Cytosine deaminase n=1 Tax=Kitasatospora kifunensis TaxID=58351 RepID=A0A7W7R5C6_KITKI|nr:hydrolase [Kitasatospora kifunensis]MBB4925166.1 cytosine deaminase [Kitasatospora kifunensis]
MSPDSASPDGPHPGQPGSGPPGSGSSGQGPAGSGPPRPGAAGGGGSGSGAGNPLGHGPVLLLSGARLADGRVVDVRISGDRIQAVGTAGSLGPLPQSALPVGAACGGEPTVAAGARIDLTGYLLLPAPAEPHAHHDTAFTGAVTGGADPRPASPPVSDGPGVAVPAAEDWGIVRRVTEAALTSLGYGATAQRTHVRIGDVHGLRRLEAVLTARQALRGLAELQAVAVPRLLTGLAGAEGRAQLREALRLGADAVGGCPELDPDPAGYVQTVVAAAVDFDCPVDLHLRGGDPAQLARLAALLAPLRPRVAVGPCDLLATGTGASLRAAGLRVVCLPQNGSCCAVDGPPGGLRPSLVGELMAERIPLAAGSGSLRDAANPVGRADPLEAAYLLAAGGALSVSAAYEAISGQARQLMGLPPVRVDAGFPAELLAVRGDSLAGALSGGHSRLVVHSGRVVSRTSAVREFADTVALALPRQSGHH